MTQLINPQMTEGVQIEYTNESGWTERAFITQQYKSAMGIWCLELHTGERIQLHNARLTRNKYDDNHRGAGMAVHSQLLSQ